MTEILLKGCKTLTHPSIILQSMLGDIDKAMKTIHNFHQVWKQFGFLPEFYNIVKNEAHAGREGYPLRPGKVLEKYPVTSKGSEL